MKGGGGAYMQTSHFTSELNFPFSMILPTKHHFFLVCFIEKPPKRGITHDNVHLVITNNLLNPKGYLINRILYM